MPEWYGFRSVHDCIEFLIRSMRLLDNNYIHIYIYIIRKPYFLNLEILPFMYFSVFDLPLSVRVLVFWAEMRLGVYLAFNLGLIFL